MSIVKMKRCRMLAMRDDREKLIKELQKLGCMQITEHEAGDEARELGRARGEGERLLEFRSELTRVSAALKLLDKYASLGKGYIKMINFHLYISEIVPIVQDFLL